jgi:hypothetical protein
MFRSRRAILRFDGLEDNHHRVLAGRSPMSERLVPVARAPLSCCGLRLGVQGEEAHQVMRDREPQQMDAGLNLAAQG